MSVKVTVVAPSNIAFIKYWGTRDLERTLPFNPSLSMRLCRCATRTTVVCRKGTDADEVVVRQPAGKMEIASGAFHTGVVTHLDRLRAWARVDCRFRIATENSFPTGTGIASSASGFAALALAVVGALGREVTREEASRLARISGSGSAARSVMGGYVEWPAGGDQPDAARQVLPPEHWNLRDVIAVLDASAKEVSSREGHRRAISSPYFEARQELLASRLRGVYQALLDRDFAALTRIVEEEAIDLHLIAMSSRPPIFYWQPGTLTVLESVRRWRDAGLEVCATMDAGANVHLICTEAAEPGVVAALEKLSAVRSVIRDGVGDGPRNVDDHLF
jgi:diphosphomevalonate decarboxylase